MGASYPWMLFVLGILLSFSGAYLAYSNPLLGITPTGQTYVYSYSWGFVLFLSLPGIILVLVALWKAKKSD
jgi:hypothetical protein